jgi:hypothetical protein
MRTTAEGWWVPVPLAHVWRKRDGRVVVFSDAQFNIERIELNELGSRIWELCDGRRSVKEIAEELAKGRSDVRVEDMASLVEAFLEELRSHWLLMPRDELESYE